MSRANSIDRETLLAAIQGQVKAAGGVRIGMEKFIVYAKIGRRNIHRYFSSWSEALSATGFDFDPCGKRVEMNRLLADWGAVARKLRRVPTYKSYMIHGKYDSSTIRKRFKSWHDIRPAFRKFAEGKPEWADVVAFCPLLPPAGAPYSSRCQRSRKPPVAPKNPGFGPRLEDRRVYGTPLHLPGLGNAPMNESGVVFLFGVLAERLGFHVEAVQIAFPDCKAKRRVGPSAWQDVTIEFEYESRNFKEHGHQLDGCDIIVCWTHNWPECPETLQVVALSDEIEQIKAGDCAP